MLCVRLYWGLWLDSITLFVSSGNTAELTERTKFDLLLFPLVVVTLVSLSLAFDAEASLWALEDLTPIF